MSYPLHGGYLLAASSPMEKYLGRYGNCLVSCSLTPHLMSTCWGLSHNSIMRPAALFC